MTLDTGVRFLIAALATWRLAFLLARERGPWGVFGGFRRAATRFGLGELLKCVKCVGLWVAVPFAFFVCGSGWDLLVTWLALAGVTALIDEWTRSPFEWQESREEGGKGDGTGRRDDQVADRGDRGSIS
jgi:hypothetical protein